MSKPKIAFVATYVGKINRGAESFSIELAKKLQYDYDLTVFSMGTAPELTHITHQIAVKKPFWLDKANALASRSLLARFICGHQPLLSPFEYMQIVFIKKCLPYLAAGHFDLIIACNGGVGAHWLPKLRARTGTPYIYINHGGLGKSEFLALQDHPDCYVTINNQQRRWAEVYYDRVARIPNGVDCQRFTPSATKTPHDHKIILDVAALTAFKRPKLIIDAMCYMPANTKLVLAGKGELEKEITQYGLNKLGAERFAVCSAPYEQMPELYRTADVFTLPSYDEPFGIVYLEALASGLPIVAPDDEIRTEIAGIAGIVCNVSRPQEYAAALQSALQQDWGNRPREQALKYDWAKIALKYDDLIKKILAEQNAR